MRSFVRNVKIISLNLFSKMHLNPKKIEIVSFDDIVNATVLSVSTATIATTFENDIKSSSGFQHKNINRTRKKVEIIFKDVLPRFTRKA